ncbi:tetratricopeptide repeat protein [candidate division WOR-3 bacterium]|nr:tetratricopeptide repeat protein [candidate division WOR-3 bacterium]
MRKLVPETILNSFSEGKSEGNFNAYILTADISGFTSITEALADKSREGSEVISEAINSIFTPVIELIISSHGFVSSFAGDSFTSLFPTDFILKEDIIVTAKRITLLLSKTKEIKSKFGNFSFSVKVGLAKGDIFWKIVQSDERSLFFFHGEALRKCGDLMNEPRTAANLDFFDGELSSNLDTDGIFFKKSEEAIPVQKDYDEKYFFALKNFYPENIFRMKESGEFRNVVTCFISIKDDFINDVNAALIIETASKYGAYLNKIDFGEKGWIALLVFGAPSGIEKMSKRAVSFSFEILYLLGEAVRIGLTSGTVYAGFIGSDKRCEYTVIGSSVNLASRISQIAEWGEVFSDKNFFEESRFFCSAKKEKKEVIKGFEGKETLLYCLKERKDIFQSEIFEGPFVSRANEIGELKKTFSILREGKPAGIVLVEGPAGVGKTRFLNHAKNTLFRKGEVTWLRSVCDDLLRASFHPFTELLKNYFQCGENFTEKERIESFDKIFENHLSSLSDKGVKEELSFGRIFLYALLGFKEGSEVYTRYDAKAVYDNTINTLILLFRSFTLLKPLVLEIEDTNWIDPDSLKLVNYLTAGSESFPLCVIMSYRIVPGRGASPYVISHDNINKISLGAINRKDSNIYITQRLKELSGSDKNFPQQLIDRITQITEGNPLFMEQILLFLKNKGKLASPDLPIETEFEFPSNINSLIISRIDLLKFRLKGLVKAASVLGKDFETRVLARVAETSDISEFLEEGERETIWSPMSLTFYAFLHAMIRECVYRMQLIKDLKLLHKKAGEAIEEMFSAEIEEKYEELSHHFEFAEEEEKHILYLYKSAEKLASRYRYADASEYFGKLFNVLLSENLSTENPIGAEQLQDIDRKTQMLGPDVKFEKVLINAAEIERFLGNWQKADEYYCLALDISKKKNDYYMKALAQRNLGRHMLNKGEYSEALKILREAEKYFKENSFEKELSQVFGDLGFLYASQGDYSSAMNSYEAQRKICEKNSDEKGLSQVMLDEGVVYWRQGYIDKAMKAFERQLEISKKIQDKRLYARAVGNMGLAFAMQGKFENAKKCLEENLEMVKELGDRVELSKTYGNLGVLNKDLGNLKEAERLFSLKLSVAKEIGDKAEIQQVTANMGLLRMELGDNRIAKRYFLDSLAISKSLKDEKGKAFILRSIGQLYYSNGKFKKSIEFFEKSRKISEKIGEQIGVFTCLGNIGIAYTDLGQNKKALEYLKRQISEAEKTKNEWNKMYALRNYGYACVKSGFYSEADKCLRKSAKIAFSLKNEKFMRDIILLGADLDILMGKFKSAEKKLKSAESLCKDMETIVSVEILRSKLLFLSSAKEIKKMHSVLRMIRLYDRNLSLKPRADLLYEMSKNFCHLQKKSKVSILEEAENLKTLFGKTTNKERKSKIIADTDHASFYLLREAEKALRKLIKNKPSKEFIKKHDEIVKLTQRKKYASSKKK